MCAHLRVQSSSTTTPAPRVSMSPPSACIRLLPSLTPAPAPLCSPRAHLSPKLTDFVCLSVWLILFFCCKNYACSAGCITCQIHLSIASKGRMRRTDAHTARHTQTPSQGRTQGGTEPCSFFLCMTEEFNHREKNKKFPGVESEMIHYGTRKQRNSCSF